MRLGINEKKMETVRERERANAKWEVNGRAEGFSFFLLRWMYNKWKGKMKPQESREARKDCEAKRKGYTLA